MTRIARLLDVLAIVLAFVVVWLLGSIWAERFVYPYDLEWMEGGMLGHTWRLLQGLELYPRPGPDFIPYVYPPGFASVVAVASKVGGLTYQTGRLVALVGVFAAAAAIAWGVWRQTGSRLDGALTAVVFLGAYPASGAFYDMVRPDSAFVGLLAWAIVIALERRRGAEVAAGLLLAASFVMKQNAAAFGVPILLGIFARDGWKSAVRFGLAAALPAGGFVLYMQLVSDGRFLQYLVEVPNSHPKIWARVMPGLPREIGTHLPFATALPALWFVASLRRWAPGLPVWVSTVLPVAAGLAFGWVGSSYWEFGPEIRPFGSGFAFWGIGAASAGSLLIVGSAFVSWLAGVPLPRFSWRFVFGVGVMAVALVVAAIMRAHNGGYVNVYMHLHWVLAFAFGITVSKIRRGWDAPIAPVAAAFPFVAQLAWQGGTLDRAQLVPSAEDRSAGDVFVQALSTYQGPVLSPYAAWLPYQAGQAPSVHLIALWDLDYPGGPFLEDVERFKQSVREHYWVAAVEGNRPFGYGLLANYDVEKTVLGEGRTFAPRTGWLVKPVKILVPKGAARRTIEALPSEPSEPSEP